MTKKDFEAVAGTLNRVGRDSQNWQAVSLCARSLAITFKAGNERFSFPTFYIACGLALDGTPR